jgi:predicted transcriptional regulator
MNIGDFVEKHEHEIREKGEHVDREILLSALGSLFQTVVEREALHMSIITAR